MIVFAVVIALIGMVGALYIASPLAKGATGPFMRLAAFGVAALIALGALGAYLVGGSPGLEGRPYAEVERRLADADPETLTLSEQEERLRSIARRNPDDAQAQAMLGRFLSRTDRHLEGVAMMERSLRIEADPRVMSDLGQSLVALNEGQVTPEAERAFLAAASADPALPEPAFFLGAAAYEAGDRETAAERWAGIVGRLEPGDPFGQAIASRAADLLSRPQGGPVSEDDAAPFADADPDDTDAMVDRMIGGLEARLEDDPDDLSGWMTLARVRAMTGEPDAARSALTQARSRFGADAGADAIITALETALGTNEDSET